MLDNTQKDLLISILIGDGGIYKQGRFASYKIAVGHGEAQKDYCQWKMNLLNESGIFDSNLTLHTRKIRHPNGKEYIQYCFTKCNFCLKYIFDRIIIEGKKSIRNVLSMLKTKRAIAIWFMDDGGVEQGRWKDKDGNIHSTRPNLKLCTNSFPYDEQLLIQKWFKQHYNINCKIREEHKTHTTYFLWFPVDDAEKLYKEILRDYIFCCESMKHKFRYFIEKYE